MEEADRRCRNCGEFTTTAYCGNCGQRSSVDKVTFRETFHDLADNLFSISAPLPRTLKFLIVDPGLLFREYLQGKRKKYYKPISFFILATAFYLFLRWAVGFEISGTYSVDQSAAEQVDPDLFRQAVEFMFQNINSMAFFFVFTMSISLKLFFYKRYMLSEYLAVAFYLNGVYSLLASLNTLYMKFINPEVQYLAILFMWAYFIYAMIGFFQTKPVLTGIKSAIAFILSWMGYFFVALNFSYLIVLLKN